MKLDTYESARNYLHISISFLKNCKNERESTSHLICKPCVMHISKVLKYSTRTRNATNSTLAFMIKQDLYIVDVFSTNILEISLFIVVIKQMIGNFVFHFRFYSELYVLNLDTMYIDVVVFY